MRSQPNHVVLKQLVRRGLVFAFLFFCFQISSLAFSPVAEAAPPATVQGYKIGSCDWKSASQIVCSGISFYFDPVKSISAGHAVFAVVKENKPQIKDNETLYLHLNQGDPDSGIITRDLTNSPTKDDASNIFVETISSDNQASCQLEIAGGDHEGQIDGTETVSCDDVSNKDIENGWRQYDGDSVHHLFVCGLYSRNGHTCWNAAGPNNGIEGTNSTRITISDPGNVIEKIQKDIGAAIASRDNCTADSGLLGFVLCPLVDASRSTVEKLIGSDGSGKGFLVELLTVRPLSASPGNSLYKAWEGIRNIALGLYIVIFALIIFGNGVGYDPYTIKKALPKLAIGVLLTFGSFYIMQALIDLSNLAGNALPAFLANITNNSALSSYNISLPINALGWGIVILLIAMFLAIIALIIGIAGLLVRLITIYALVLLAPIAFVAWVLPNTESIFKKWWKNLIKVLMMFPIVTGMLALSLFFQTVILTTDKNAGGIGNTLSSGVTSLIGLIIPLMALIMIPKTFKWGGEAFAAGAGYLAGKATSGTNKVKDMPGKAANKAATSAKQGVMASEKAQAFGAGLATNRVTRMFGGKQAQRNLATARSQRLNDAEKLTADMSTDQLGKVAKIGNFQEKVAAIGQLAKKGDRGALLQLSQASGPTRAAYELASSRYAGDWDKNIDLRRMPGKDPQDVSKLSVEAISKMSDDTLGANLAAGKFEHSQLIDLANNDRAKASMSPRAKSYIDMYSAATATTRPREGVQTPVTSIPGLDTALATHQGEAGDKFNTPIPPPAGTP